MYIYIYIYICMRCRQRSTRLGLLDGIRAELLQSEHCERFSYKGYYTLSSWVSLINMCTSMCSQLSKVNWSKPKHTYTLFCHRYVVRMCGYIIYIKLVGSTLISHGYIWHPSQRTSNRECIYVLIALTSISITRRRKADALNHPCIYSKRSMILYCNACWVNLCL